MLDVGSFLAFYGCLWTGLRIAVEPLTPWYDLTTHWTDEAGRRAIAASLSAFINTVKRLEDHYLQVQNLPPRKGTYPYPTSYTEEETGQQINFEYETRVAEEKLVFTAKADAEGIGPLIVKFTRRYSAEAHKLLAGLGHAPRLRAIVTLPGSWIMVVMEFLPYPLLRDLTFALSDRSRQKVLSKLPISSKHYTKTSSFTGTYDPSIYSSTIKPLQKARTWQFIYSTSIGRGGLGRSSTRCT